jgi:hypothetical protein
LILFERRDLFVDVSKVAWETTVITGDSARSSQLPVLLRFLEVGALVGSSCRDGGNAG